jgi:hypothetical protein
MYLHANVSLPGQLGNISALMSTCARLLTQGLLNLVVEFDKSHRRLTQRAHLKL